jgi:hypothetical protein
VATSWWLSLPLPSSHPFGQVLAGCSDGSVGVLDVDLGSMTHRFPAHSGQVHSLSVLSCVLLCPAPKPQQPTATAPELLPAPDPGHQEVPRPAAGEQAQETEPAFAPSLCSSSQDPCEPSSQQPSPDSTSSSIQAATLLVTTGEDGCLKASRKSLGATTWGCIACWLLSTLVF